MTVLSMTDVTVDRPPFRLIASLAVDQPGFTVLYGPSGAGKTTLLDTVAGLIRPTGGVIGLGDTVLADPARGYHQPAWRRGIGYVFQDLRLFPHLSVRANLLYGARRRPASDRAHDLEAFSRLLGLDALMDRRPHRLSGGERRRVAIGRALMARPRLLLMDEPLTSLDADLRADLLPYLARLRGPEAPPVLYVSHDPDELLRLADTVVVVADGAVRRVGPVAGVLADPPPQVARALGGPATVIDSVIDPANGDADLDRLLVSGTEFWVGKTGAPGGAPVRVRIPARDVVLAADRPPLTSALNVLSGPVTQIRTAGPGGVDVALDVGFDLWSRISQRSAERLGVSPGRSLYALVKAASADTVDRPATSDRPARNVDTMTRNVF